MDMAALSYLRSTFLGSSLVSAQTSLGWNGQNSTLAVTLADDQVNGDSFAPPTPGTPVYFSYGSLRFGGILQSYEESREQSGNPLYQVTVHDPRDILGGVSVILRGYTGSLGGIPNILNVYGHWENQGFGTAQVNDAGMPWPRVRDGLKALINRPTANAYGGPIVYRGVSYGIDLSRLPAPSNAYRVAADPSITLLDLIGQICDDCGADFYVELDGLIIRVKTQSRRTQPPLGTISALVDSQYGNLLKSSSHGLEDRNEVTTAFLTGGDVQLLHLTASLTSFWGLDFNGSPILGVPARVTLGEEGLTCFLTSGVNRTDTTFYLKDWFEPEKVVLPNLPFYMSVGSEIFKVVSKSATFSGRYEVLRAQFGTASATHPKDAVCRVVYHSEVCDHFNLNCSQYADIIGSVSYPCCELELRLAKGGMESWQAYMKKYRKSLAERIGVTPVFGDGGGKKAKPKDGVPDDARIARAKAESALTNDRNSRQTKFYEFVRDAADTYLGKKYAVALPFVLSSQDSETLQITFSYNITDGGYLPEGAEPLGLSNLNEDVFKLNDGRLRCFAVYNDLSDVNYEFVSVDGTVIEDGSFYTPAQPDRSIAFAPAPISVITLPGPLLENPVNANSGGEIIGALLGTTLSQRDKMHVNTAGGNVSVRVSPPVKKPYAAAIPIRSNVLKYGPWYLAGAPGKTSVISDPSLTPWTYGSYAAMNAAGLSKVAQAAQNMTVAEYGNCVLAAAPLCSLGEALVSGGPNVTNMSVQIGQEVTTRYEFRTFTPAIWSEGKQFADRVRRNSLAGVDARKALRAATIENQGKAETLGKLGRSNKAWLENFPKALKKESPHTVLVGAVDRDDDPIDATEPGGTGTVPGYVRSSVSAMTFEEAVIAARPDDDAEYRKIAVMGMNGLIRPFSTNVEGDEYLSTFTAPSGGFEGKFSQAYLNPLKDENDIEVHAWGTGYVALNAWREKDVVERDNSRLLGLRGPLVITGFGVDADLQEVPGTGYTLTQASEWKTGPVDHYWDNRRGVWSSHDVLTGLADGAIAQGGSGTVSVYSQGVLSDWHLQVRSRIGAVPSGTLVHCLLDVNENCWNVIPPPSDGSVGIGRSTDFSASGGYYPAVETAYDGGWSDEEAVQLHPVNGGVLEKGIRYPMTYSHTPASGLPVYTAFSHDQPFATVSSGRKAGDGSVAATLYSPAGSRPTDGQAVRLLGLNDDDFVAGRKYEAWPAGATVTPASGGFPEDYSLTAAGFGSGYTTLNGTFTLTEDGGLFSSSGDEWELDPDAETLSGTEGTGVAVYTADSWEPLALTNVFSYFSGPTGVPTLTLTAGAIDVQPPGSGLTTYPVYLADPLDVEDPCDDYTGDREVLIDFDVACVSGVFVKTRTYETWTFACGKLVSVS